MIGPSYQDSGLVFTRPDGSPIHPHLFSDWFKQHVRKAGLPKIRLHDVRHSYASAALAAGIAAKVVSERLGHATIAITMDTYSHVLPGLDERAAATVAQLILEGDDLASASIDKTLTNGTWSPVELEVHEGGEARSAQVKRLAEADGYAYAPGCPVAEPVGHHTDVGTGELRNPICRVSARSPPTLRWRSDRRHSTLADLMGQ